MSNDSIVTEIEAQARLDETEWQSGDTALGAPPATTPP